jgi:hypothetical protein
MPQHGPQLFHLIADHQAKPLCPQQIVQDMTSQLVAVQVEATNADGHIFQPLIIVASHCRFELAGHIVTDPHLRGFRAIRMHGF